MKDLLLSVEIDNEARLSIISSSISTSSLLQIILNIEIIQDLLLGNYPPTIIAAESKLYCIDSYELIIRFKINNH